MNIVVLLKAVPVVGTEKLTADQLTDRSVALEANGNDEYTLEKALKLVDADGGEVTVLSVGPAGAVDAIRKALAMGAAKAVHVADDALRGSDIPATVNVLAAALGRLEFDLLLAGADTSDGQGGVVGAALAARLGLPYLSYA
ncbi:MAG TPA: electron transfer flavoprotein subunit beta, partial [Candidatus Limnocylindria bacterium]|nr:electron transfer flavoprotein subunit beta [Candidatus Limnocylindria bacterium]